MSRTMAICRYGLSWFPGAHTDQRSGGRAKVRGVPLPRAFTAAALFLLLQVLSPTAMADYRVQRGDVLQISVAGSPQLQRRVMIDNDGKIYFPLIGEMNSEGLTLGQIRELLRNQLAAKHSLENADITVDIPEYRPISVAGDIAQPGAYPYRPGMTVRDAVALAGGDRRQRLLDTFNARDQFGASRVKSVRLQIHSARLKAELLGKTDIDLANMQVDAATARIASEFSEMEAQQLKIEQQDYDNEKAHLARVIGAIQDQISALVAQQAQQQATVTEQQKQAARAQQLLQRSLIQIARVEEEERVLANSTGQLLELKARTAQARRDLEEAARKLERLADQRKIDLTQRLETATAELATVEVSLQTFGQEVRCVEEGAERSSYSLDAEQIVIFRRERADLRRIAADLNTNLLPGDAIEIGQGAAPILLGLGSTTDQPPAVVAEATRLRPPTEGTAVAPLTRGSVLSNTVPCPTAMAARPEEPAELKNRSASARVVWSTTSAATNAPMANPNPSPGITKSRRLGQ